MKLQLTATAGQKPSRALEGGTSQGEACGQVGFVRSAKRPGPASNLDSICKAPVKRHSWY